MSVPEETLPAWVERWVHPRRQSSRSPEHAHRSARTSPKKADRSAALVRAVIRLEEAAKSCSSSAQSLPEDLVFAHYDAAERDACVDSLHKVAVSCQQLMATVEHALIAVQGAGHHTSRAGYLRALSEQITLPTDGMRWQDEWQVRARKHSRSGISGRSAAHTRPLHTGARDRAQQNYLWRPVRVERRARHDRGVLLQV